MLHASIQVLDDRLSRAQKKVIEVLLTKTSSSTIAPLTAADPAIVGMGANLDRASAAALQAEVNAALGVDSPTATTEIDCATLFASTPMGTDALGLVLPCAGQIRKVHLAEIVAPAATAAIKDVKPAALSTTLGTDGLAVTPAGNLALRITDAGLDAAGSGSVVKIRIYVDVK